MASLRCDTRIARPPDEVWALVSDPGRIVEWFPGMETVVVEGSTRTITLRSGLPLIEEVVNVDPRLRRFQYRIVGPLPVEHHLGTVDVLDDDGATRVVYSTEITPDPLAFVIDGAIAAAVGGLKTLSEGGPTAVTSRTAEPTRTEGAS
ncbi:SRPBCC family protein [Rhabdothermincola salaria]|uniref:SRPBCC family protein n=1 Tax=Rhabdothermincola salaria TaxID=2903142 RepID=UPI001E4B3636|nr:SRPBCC family protein [Rhabdothermincola salaria]MCD9624160.1 SRPBCC family protein [Rhabdothermincola salaria]